LEQRVRKKIAATVLFLALKHYSIQPINV